LNSTALPNTKAHFVLRYTKEGASNAKRLISYLKSKHRIHANHQSVDPKATVFSHRKKCDHKLGKTKLIFSSEKAHNSL